MGYFLDVVWAVSSVTETIRAVFLSLSFVFCFGRLAVVVVSRRHFFSFEFDVGRPLASGGFVFSC